MKTVIFGLVKCALLVQLAVIHASPHPQQSPGYVYVNQGYPGYVGQYSQLLSRQRRPGYPVPYPEYNAPAPVQPDYQGHVQQQQHQQDYQGAGQQQQVDYQGAGQQQVSQDQGNVPQAPTQPDPSDDRAQHYGGNGSPLIFIYPTEGEPIVVHDQKQQRPPMQIFGSFSPQRPTGLAPDRLQDPQPFFQIPTQILSQPGPIRQWIDNVGNWFSPPRQAMTVLYPTTSTVLVPHFVTVTASCTA